MTTPFPGLIPGRDVSLERKADLITAKGGDALQEELERPRRRWRRPLRLFRRRSNPPDPRDPHILSAREVARIRAGRDS